MKEIKLTRGKSAIIDDDDFEELSKYRWCDDGRGYATRHVIAPSGEPKSMKMHIQIAGLQKGLQIDHIDGNPLNNRRENLRHVTGSQNQYNQKSNRGGSSQYKGVSWHKQIKKWTARIKAEGKTKNLGCFKAEEDAARAYNKIAKETWGEYARLNVLED